MTFLRNRQPSATTPALLNSIPVNSSRYGQPVSLVYGMQRIPLTLLWYGAFTATAQSTSSGGKGGGGRTISGYNYTASCVLGLCEGPISAVNQVWKDKGITTLANEDLLLFYGTGGQSPWAYLTSNFPGQAVPYDHTAYIGAQNMNLGSSASIPNFTFEVQGFLSLPGSAATLTSGLGVGAISATLLGTSPVADGVWDVTFSDYETRSVTFTTISSITYLTWDSTMGLVNGSYPNIVIGGYDAEPSAIIIDFCTDVNHSCGFPYLNQSQITSHSWISGATTYYDNFTTYCIANSLQISPWEDTQRTAAAFLSDILELTNSNCVMSADSLSIIPYADAPVTGNGVTFTPNLQPLFAFTDDDYMMSTSGSGGAAASNEDPVQMSRKPLTETYNVVRVEFFDRSNNYNAAIAEWSDPLDIAINGIRCMATKTFHQITNAHTALQVASLIGQRQLYIRNTYQFSVRADLYSLLEPMDLVAITDKNLGLNNVLVRIIETQDDKDDLFTITAEEMLVGTASAPRYNIQAAQGYYANYAQLPPAVATPVIFSSPPALVGPGGGYEIWCGVAAGTPLAGESDVYGGCNVFASMDDLTWDYLGSMSGQSRIGTVTAAHAIGAADTTIYLTMNAQSVTDGYQLNAASPADFAANRALIYVDGEIMGFQTVTLLSAGNYSLSVSRGLFGTPATTHAAGAAWARLDQAIFKFAFDPGMIGQTMYLKFYAFSEVGQEVQATATAYSHVIENSNNNQLIGGPLSLTGTGIGIHGTAIYKTANTSAWDSGAWSAQSYTNGAFVSFSPTDITSQGVAGLAPTNGLISYTGFAFALFCDAGTLIAYEGANATTLGSYAVGDVLEAAYDGNIAYYYKNATLLRQVPTLNGQSLYFNSVFFTTQDKFSHLQFGPSGTTTPAQFKMRGNNCWGSDSNVAKIAGSSAWDSDMYSILGYATCNLSWKANDIGVSNFMGALTTAIPATPGYTGLNYAMQCGAGTWQIYESGTGVSGATGSYTNTDFFSITYDGAHVLYAINGTAVRSVSVSSLKLYADFVLYAPNSAAGSINWGPGSIVPFTDTPQMTNNAITSTSSSSSAGPINVTSTSFVNVFTLTLPVQTYAGECVLSGQCIATPNAAGSSAFDIFYNINSIGNQTIGGTVVPLANAAEYYSPTFAFPFPAGATIVVGIEAKVGSGVTSLAFTQMVLNAVILKK